MVKVHDGLARKRSAHHICHDPVTPQSKSLGLKIGHPRTLRVCHHVPGYDWTINGGMPHFQTNSYCWATTGWLLVCQCVQVHSTRSPHTFASKVMTAERHAQIALRCTYNTSGLGQTSTLSGITCACVYIITIYVVYIMHTFIHIWYVYLHMNIYIYIYITIITHDYSKYTY